MVRGGFALPAAVLGLTILFGTKASLTPMLVQFCLALLLFGGVALAAANLPPSLVLLTRGKIRVGLILLGRINTRATGFSRTSF